MKPILSAIAVLYALAGTVWAMDVTSMVCTRPQASLIWKTVPGENPQVQLSWPDGAVKAVLSVDGALCCEVADTAVQAKAITMPLPLTSEEERVRLFEVAYYDKDENELERQSARLGYVLGTADDEIPFISDATSKKWEKCKSDKAVVLLPADTLSLKIGESEMDISDVPDWYELTGIDTSGFMVTLTGSETQYSSYVRRVPASLMLILR